MRDLVTGILYKIKFKTMKNLLFICVAFVITSCGREIVDGVYYLEYDFINKSSADITINSYFGEEKYTYYIKKDSTYYQKKEMIFGSNSKLIYDSDSAIVIYDNNKYKMWRKLENVDRDIDRSIHNFKSYTEVGKKENSTKYEYIFTEEDYNQAQPCNGNCD